MDLREDRAGVLITSSATTSGNAFRPLEPEQPEVALFTDQEDRLQEDGVMLRIGELAAETGESVKTLRFWESHGLLEADRSESGYRYFSSNMAERSRFIRQAQSLGFTLNEIHGILELRDDGLQPCEDVRSRLRAHLAAIRERQRELEALESELDSRLRWAEADAEPLCEDGCVYLGSKQQGN